MPGILDEFRSRTALRSDLLIQLCRVRSLMHHVRCGSWLRAILIRCTCHLLSRSRNADVGQLPRVFRFDGVHWVPRTVRMGMMWILHRSVCVNDILSLTICSWVDGIVRILESCSGLPCFCGPGTLVTCHVFLGEPLLDRFAFPIIVPYSSSTLDYPCAKLTKH